MRILHIFSLSGRASGIVVVVSELTAEMLKKGDSVGWLSSFPVGEGQRSMLPAGVDLLGAAARTSGFGSIFPGGNWAIPAWGSPKQLPDVVHIHGIYLAPHARLASACRRQGIPYIVTPHGTFMAEAQKYQWLKKALANKLIFLDFLGNAAAIHTLGAEEAREIERIFPRALVRTIPNGIRIDDLKAPKLQVRRPEGLGNMFLFIGRLDVHHKGLDILLEGVCNAALEFRRSRSRMMLVGPFDAGWDRSILTKLIVRSSLEDFVSIEGSKYGEDKRRLILESDVFVHTSRYEGLPMAVLEAMALGKPCLVTPGTNLASVIDECDAGWTTKMDPGSIAESLISIIGTPRDVLKSKGLNAQKLVSERFMLSRTVEELRALYRDVIEKRARQTCQRAIH